MYSEILKHIVVKSKQMQIQVRICICLGKQFEDAFENQTNSTRGEAIKKAFKTHSGESQTNVICVTMHHLNWAIYGVIW